MNVVERLSSTVSARVVGLLLAAIIAGQVVGLTLGDGTVPLAVQVGLSASFGCFYALSATGLVLVHRATRIINFAQTGFGTTAAMLFLLLTTVWTWNVWATLLLSLAFAALIGMVIEVLLLRRFSAAPRLVLTVVTIAIGQLLAAATLLLPRIWGLGGSRGGANAIPRVGPQSPFDRFSVRWSGVVITGDALFAVAATFVLLGGLVLFLRSSRVGVAIRGAAENKDRAAQLGVNTNNLSSVVWAIVAVLGAAGAILSILVADRSLAQVMGSASGSIGSASAAIGIGSLLRALAAAVIARFESLAIAIGAAIAIAMFEVSVLWATGETRGADIAVFLLIVGVLLLQRRGESRVDASATSSWVAAEELRGIPHELAPLPPVRRMRSRALTLAAVAVLAYPWVMSPSQTNLGGVYAIYGIVGISLVVLTGWAGQISLGQFAFVAVGAVVGGSVGSRLGLPFPVALVVGSAAAAAVAVLVGLPALRIRGLYLAVTTLALALVTPAVLFDGGMFGWLLPGRIGRPSFFGIDTGKGETGYYYVCLASLAAVVWAVGALRASRTGRLLIALRDNERAAQTHAVNLVRVRLLAFAVSGALAGFAGVLFAYHQQAVTASSFASDRSVLVFLMAVIGGLGSVTAVLVGAIYIATATIVIPDLGGQILAGAAGVLGVLVLLPSGLGSVAYRLRDAWLRRVASRHRILVPSLVGGRVKRGEEALVPLAPPLRQAAAARSYRLPSRIGDAGASQVAEVWRY